MTTPPNTELKSNEEWTSKWWDENMTIAELVIKVRHEAMLHAAEIVINSSTDNYGSLSYCKDLILTRAEQILKGEK